MHRGLPSYYNKMDDDDDDHVKGKGKLIFNIVIMVVSVILAVSIAIAFVANTNNTYTYRQADRRTPNSLISVCSKTVQPEICLHILRPVGGTGKALDYVNAAIDATCLELLMVDKPKPYFNRSLTPLQAQSQRDCLELLKLGNEELESLYVTANSSVDMSKMNLDDVINSLSAAISYQQTCFDELLQTNSYQAFGYSLERSIMYTRITLAIVNYFFSERPTITAKAEPVYIPNPNPQRVLSAAIDLGSKHNRFPSWFSLAKRKLLGGGGGGKQPDAVVAQDGSGQFSTITESLNVCQKKNKGPCSIYVKKGKYEERVVVPKDVDQVLMYGDGPVNTIVSGINKRDPKKVTTSFQAASFVVMGKGFICKDMAFTAPADIKGATALLVLSDHAAFFNCKIQGEEGTLFAVAQRQFYRDCEIHGTANIIKGDSTTIIQNSQIIVKARNSSDSCLKKNVVSAQFRLDKNERTGFVIQNCTITAQGENISLAGTTYLGTPYKEYSTTIIMESFLGDVIHPEGWCKWSSDKYGTETATFLEYNNRGPSAKADRRVSWYSYQTISQKSQMVNYTASQFIQTDKWLQSAGIPYQTWFVFR